MSAQGYCCCGFPYLSIACWFGRVGLTANVHNWKKYSMTDSLPCRVNLQSNKQQVNKEVVDSKNINIENTDRSNSLLTGDDSSSLLSSKRKLADCSEPTSSSSKMKLAKTSTADDSKNTTVSEAKKHTDQKLTVQEMSTEEVSTEHNVTVLETSQFKKSDQPEKDLQTILNTLSSNSWIEQYETIDLIRRLTIHHEKLLLPHINHILEFLRLNAVALRSAQCRNALLAFGDLFRDVQSVELLIDINKTIEVLVNRSVNDKKFIATAASAALRQVSTSLPCEQVLSSLLGHSSSKNNKVCLVIADCASRCVRQMSKEQITQCDIKNILSKVHELESGKCVKARMPSQSIYKDISKAMGNDNFNTLIKSTFSSIDYNHIEKIVKPKPKKSSKASRMSIKEIMLQKRAAANNNDDSSFISSNAGTSSAASSVASSN